MLGRCTFADDAARIELDCPVSTSVSMLGRCTWADDASRVELDCSVAADCVSFHDRFPEEVFDDSAAACACTSDAFFHGAVLFSSAVSQDRFLDEFVDDVGSASSCIESVPYCMQTPL